MAGQSVTYIAEVAGAGVTPTCTVTLEDDGIQIGGPVNLLPAGRNGLATLSQTYNNAGTHSITATYSGDNIHEGSTSAGLTQTVHPNHNG